MHLDSYVICFVLVVIVAHFMETIAIFHTVGSDRLLGRRCRKRFRDTILLVAEKQMFSHVADVVMSLLLH